MGDRLFLCTIAKGGGGELILINFVICCQGLNKSVRVCCSSHSNLSLGEG